MRARGGTRRQHPFFERRDARGLQRHCRYRTSGWRDRPRGKSAGLSINDVQTKVIPFAQMAVAFQTKAVDAGLEITPFTALLPKQELAVAWIDSDAIVKPSPVMISASMFNADWARKNPDIAKRFFTALLRGVRDYCDAHHGGAWRPELLRLLVANGVSTSPELLDAVLCPSRSPDGYVPRASL